MKRRIYRKYRKFSAAIVLGTMLLFTFVVGVFAHHGEISAESVCYAGDGWQVNWTASTWTMNGSQGLHNNVKVYYRTDSNPTYQLLTTGAFTNDNGRQFSGSFVVPDSVNWVIVKVDPEGPWGNGYTPSNPDEDMRTTGKIYAPTGCDYDFGDAPETGSYATNGSGQTSFANNGGNNGDPARHKLDTNNSGGANPRFGSCVDAESDGQPVNPGEAPLGDDDNTGSPVDGTCTLNDDEDGLVSSGDDWDTGTGTVVVEVQQLARRDRFCVYGWIDLDQDGFDSQDPMASAWYVTGNSSEASRQFTLPFDVQSYADNDEFPVGLAYLRLRVLRIENRNDPCPALGPTGEAPNGEVEDHAVQFLNETAVSLQDISAIGSTPFAALVTVLLLTIATAGIIVARRKETL